MKGIDKGDIVSSGAPQMSKDGRNQNDFTQPRRTKLGNSTCSFHILKIHVCLFSSWGLTCDYTGLFQTGSKEDVPHTFDDSKDESATGSKSGHLNYPDGSSYERQTIHDGFNQKMETMQDQKTYSGNKLKAEATFIPKEMV